MIGTQPAWPFWNIAEFSIRMTCVFALSANIIELVRSPSELTTAFREQGLKLTPQRQLLFRLLHANFTHPSADALHGAAAEQMPGISLRTVYQTLNELAAMGELHIVDVGDGPLRFDPNVGDHHHMLCRICARMSDVYVDHEVTPRSAELDGFLVESTDIVFRGLCARCHQTQ